VYRYGNALPSELADELVKASSLIFQLEQLLERHGNLEVLTEGCDCYGDSGRVEYWPNMSSIMICRGSPRDLELWELEQRQREERERQFTADLEAKYPGLLP